MRHTTLSTTNPLQNDFAQSAKSVNSAKPSRSGRELADASYSAKSWLENGQPRFTIP
jgi:hypothetical protein